jgi:hypothetical protein
MKKKPVPVASENIDAAIQTIRGQKVILDADLARIYGVPTKRLNEQVKRNLDRFPEDFMFQLAWDEWRSLKSQPIEAAGVEGNRSQFATGSRGHRDPRSLPFAFTENGAIMAASILNSPEAVRLSVFVVRAFVKMRELLGGTGDLARQLKELEAKLTSRLDVHETALVEVLQRIMQLLDPPPEPEPPRRQIGFHTRREAEDRKSGKGSKPLATRRAEFRAEEKALEEAKSVRLPFKRPR